MKPYLQNDPKLKFLSALIETLGWKESNWNPAAVGDKGKAVGVWQIWGIVVEDVNRIYDTQYVWPRDAVTVAVARRIAWLYLSFYFMHTRKNHPELKMSDEELCSRIWNGGPTGYTKTATEGYWSGVHELLGKRI